MICGFLGFAHSFLGLWWFADYSQHAEKVIWFTEYESLADLKIYYVSSSSLGGWRNNDKKHLMEI